MNNKQGALIFDFDGVLADTEHVALQIVERIAVRKKIQPPTREFTRMHNPKEIMQSLNIAWWELPYIAYISRKWAAELNPEVKLFPWANSLLQTADNLDFDVWIVSSNSPQRILKALNTGENKLNPEHVYGNISFFGKAKYLNKIVNSYEHGAKQIVYLADEIRDIEAANKSGVKCISAGWGFQSPELLEKFNPGYVLQDPEKFEACVRQLINS